MFVLRKKYGSLFYLSSDKRYTVGRKNADLLLEDDQSISRNHAFLELKKNRVTLCDSGSKYNTYVNEVKIEPIREVTLQLNNTVTFGVYGNKFVLEQINLVTTSSGLKPNTKRHLEEKLKFLQGLHLSTWSHTCTHLTVEEVKLTAKVLCAVIEGKPIVSLKYWDDYVEAVKKNLPPPREADYKISSSETILSNNVSLDYDERRRTLFKNKILVFPSTSETTKMDYMISLCGGKTLSYDVNSITVPKIKHSTDEYVFIQSPEGIDPEKYNEILNYLKSVNQRTIPVQEIALAIVHCSCEKDCNPNFDRTGILLAEESPQDYSDQILVGETQSLSIKDSHPETVVPDSLEFDQILTPSNPTCSVKSEVRDKPNPFKKPQEVFNRTNAAIIIEDEESIAGTSNSSKRKTKDTSPKESRGFLKKQKLETTSANSSIVTMFRESNENRTASSSGMVKNPFARKRKCEPVETEITSVKQPRSELKSEVISIKLPQSELVTETIPIRQTLGAHSGIASNTPAPIVLDVDAIQPLDLNTTNYSWLSKSCIKEESAYETVPEVLRNCLRDGEVEEILEFINSFKGTVVIQQEDLEVTRPTTKVEQDVPSGRKNFKKFKKVKPLHMQTVILSNSSFVNVVCNQTAEPITASQ